MATHSKHLRRSANNDVALSEGGKEVVALTRETSADLHLLELPKFLSPLRHTLLDHLWEGPDADRVRLFCLAPKA